MKWTRLRKLTWKLLLVYALMIVVLAFARPQLDKPLFWTGLSLVVLGEFVRIWAAGHLVKNKRLTTTGPYSFVKNPLYVGTFLIICGFCMMAQGEGYNHWALDNINWIILGVAVLGFIAYYVPYKKKREGDRLREHFGEEWDQYDRSVPDYFPRLTPYRHPGAEPVRWTLRTVCENSEQWTALAVAVGLAILPFSPQIMEYVSRHVRG